MDGIGEPTEVMDTGDGPLACTTKGKNVAASRGATKISFAMESQRQDRVSYGECHEQDAVVMVDVGEANDMNAADGKKANVH